MFTASQLPIELLEEVIKKLGPDERDNLRRTNQFFSHFQYHKRLFPERIERLQVSSSKIIVEFAGGQISISKTKIGNELLLRNNASSLLITKTHGMALFSESLRRASIRVVERDLSLNSTHVFDSQGKADEAWWQMAFSFRQACLVDLDVFSNTAPLFVNWLGDRPVEHLRLKIKHRPSSEPMALPVALNSSAALRSARLVELHIGDHEKLAAIPEFKAELRVFGSVFICQEFLERLRSGKAATFKRAKLVPAVEEERKAEIPKPDDDNVAEKQNDSSSSPEPKKKLHREIRDQHRRCCLVVQPLYR
ncbi:unnamed protein product, partial [Mesorhabditis spiculigera]